VTKQFHVEFSLSLSLSLSFFLSLLSSLCIILIIFSHVAFPYATCIISNESLTKIDIDIAHGGIGSSSPRVESSSCSLPFVPVYPFALLLRRSRRREARARIYMSFILAHSGQMMSSPSVMKPRPTSEVLQPAQMKQSLCQCLSSNEMKRVPPMPGNQTCLSCCPRSDFPKIRGNLNEGLETSRL